MKIFPDSAPQVLPRGLCHSHLPCAIGYLFSDSGLPFSLDYAPCACSASFSRFFACRSQYHVIQTLISNSSCNGTAIRI